MDRTAGRECEWEETQEKPQRDRNLAKYNTSTSLFIITGLGKELEARVAVGEILEMWKNIYQGLQSHGLYTSVRYTVASVLR